MPSKASRINRMRRDIYLQTLDAAAASCPAHLVGRHKPHSSLSQALKINFWQGHRFDASGQFVKLNNSHRANEASHKKSAFKANELRLAMKTYIQNLNKMTTMAVSKRAQERACAVKAVFEPLETQITRWWANLPQSSRERAFLISEIAGACRGRFRERPALRDVAAALRVLGWTRQRDWRKAGNNRRVWVKNGKVNWNCKR